MFWENFTNLCKEKGTSPTALTIELGFSNATATRWKKGSVPNGSTLKRIADYFGITVDELLQDRKNIRFDLQHFAEDPKEKKPSDADGLDPILEDIEKSLKEMTDEEREEVRRYVEYLINRKKG